MKKKILPKIIPYCETHKTRHGIKWPSCVLRVKQEYGGMFDMELPSGCRIYCKITGKLRAKDIAIAYKLLKIQHWSKP